ncbi:rac GTPase-activating protein 1-like isoform X2 [Patagioenas fasciata]|uniref:rac GTPase-activating protein 1-like isoform X2 n=1 Tax=Patagioenas fasciata TaxID=372321 RepID=UPI003A9A5AFE
MLKQRCGRLLARLERAVQLLELGGRVEEDYIRIARCFEATRQRCCWLEQDGRRMREQLALVEAERAALEVKLKHARNQVEVEMKKRHRAEAELEKQERKLQLVFESLMREPLGSGMLSREQCSVLSALTGQCLGAALAPGRRWSAVDESCQSLLSHSDISYDHTEDDVDVDMTAMRTLKRKSQERQHGPAGLLNDSSPHVGILHPAPLTPLHCRPDLASPSSRAGSDPAGVGQAMLESRRVSLAPQIGPMVAAKRHRSSVAPENTQASIPPVPPPAKGLGPASSLLPTALVPRRCSRQGHRVSTCAELTMVWGTSEEPGCRAPGQESYTEGGSAEQPVPAPIPSPPRGHPLRQHQFTSKTVIRPQPCGICSSRIRFGKAAVKCRRCQLLLHPKCREQCRLSCVPRPHHHAWPREGVLADFAPATPPLVPALVVQCVTEVETRGLTETGLYRVPGTDQLVREWKQRLLRAGGVLPALSSVTDIHVVCGVLKDFLRGLKEPLVTFSLHPAFLRAADIPDAAACATALRHVVSKLPPANRDTLAFLMLHLLRVSRSPDCKMDILNLSRVFGPTLVGHALANPTPLIIMEDTPRQCKVVAQLLSLPPDFWRGFLGPEQENLVPMPSLGGECGETQESQSPPFPCSVAAEEPRVPVAGLGCDSHPPICPVESFFCPIISPEPKPGQLSPTGTCCLPNTLQSCVGTATSHPQGLAPRKVGRFFPSWL